jgi:hypothetical protein
MATQQTNGQKPRQTESAIAFPTQFKSRKKSAWPNGFSRRTRLSHEILPSEGLVAGRKPQAASTAKAQQAEAEGNPPATRDPRAQSGRTPPTSNAGAMTKVSAHEPRTETRLEIH